MSREKCKVFVFKIPRTNSITTVEKSMEDKMNDFLSDGKKEITKTSQSSVLTDHGVITMVTIFYKEK